MNREPTAYQLAKSQLERGIDELERDATRGRYNTLCIRALASAASVLHEQDIAGRALRLLRSVPDEAFWVGAISNVELPKDVPPGLRSIDTSEERCPPFRDEDVIGRIRSYASSEEHLALCLSGQVHEARARAGSGVRLEEVGSTLAVLGDFDAAVTIARDPVLDGGRRKGVLLVLVIELYRRGRVKESAAILDELDAAGFGAWERVHLALGFAGREPWGGYPYPDW